MQNKKNAKYNKFRDVIVILDIKRKISAHYTICMGMKKQLNCIKNTAAKQYTAHNSKNTHMQNNNTGGQNSLSF